MIGSISDNLVSLSYWAVKIKEDLAHVRGTLGSKSETSTNLGWIQNSITARVGGFSTAQIQADARLSLLEVAPAQTVAKLSS